MQLRFYFAGADLQSVPNPNTQYSELNTQKSELKKTHFPSTLLYSLLFSSKKIAVFKSSSLRKVNSISPI